jgi:uncharacterized RDD family membrane protein YckC
MFSLLVAGPLLGVATSILAMVILLRSRLEYRAKAIIVLFAAIAFLGRPCLLLVSYYLMSNPLSYGQFAWLLTIAYLVIEFASYLMFLVVAFQIAKLAASPISSVQDGEKGKETEVAGRVWCTKTLSAVAKHSTLRRREWAFLVDILPGLIFLLIYANFVGFFNVIGSRRITTEGTFFISFVALIGLYIVVKDCFFGISIGKRVSGCRVVDYETGKPIGLFQSLLRNILLLIPFAWILEFVVILLQKDRRRIGDWIANTIVVKGPPSRIDGVEVVLEATPVAESEFKHPLD